MLSSFPLSRRSQTEKSVKSNYFLSSERIVITVTLFGGRHVDVFGIGKSYDLLTSEYALIRRKLGTEIASFHSRPQNVASHLSNHALAGLDLIKSADGYQGNRILFKAINGLAVAVKGGYGRNNGFFAALLGKLALGLGIVSTEINVNVKVILYYLSGLLSVNVLELSIGLQYKQEPDISSAAGRYDLVEILELGEVAKLVKQEVEGTVKLGALFAGYGNKTRI